MMKRKFLVAALAVFCFSAFAQTNIKDVRTNPDLFFLKESRQVRSIFFLLHQRLAVFSGSTTRPVTIGV